MPRDAPVTRATLRALIAAGLSTSLSLAGPVLGDQGERGGPALVCGPVGPTALLKELDHATARRQHVIAHADLEQGGVPRANRIEDRLMLEMRHLGALVDADRHQEVGL